MLALGLRLAWLSIVSPGPLLDGWFYYHSARSIAAGEGFINPFNTEFGDDVQTFADFDADDFVVRTGSPQLIALRDPVGDEFSAWAFDDRVEERIGGVEFTVPADMDPSRPTLEFVLETAPAEEVAEDTAVRLVVTYFPASGGETTSVVTDIQLEEGTPPGDRLSTRRPVGAAVEAGRTYRFIISRLPNDPEDQLAEDVLLTGLIVKYFVPEVDTGFYNPPTASLPPGYPFVLSGLFVTVGADPLVAKLFNIVAGAATVVLIYVLATRIANRRAGIVAGGVLALFPSQIFFPIMIMTETFFGGLLTGLAFLLVVWLSKGKMNGWQLLLVGLLLGAMSLVRAEAVLLFPALLVLFKVLGRRWQTVAQQGFILVVGMAVLITPWTIRNYVQFNEFIPIRSGQGAPLRGIRIALSADYDDPRYTIAGGRQEPAPLDDLLLDHLQHPWQLADLGAQKIADMFGRDYAFHWTEAPRFAKGQAPPGGVTPWAALGDTYYYAVGIVVLLGIPLLLAKGDRRHLIVAWLIASWCLIHLMYTPRPRHHFAVLPMVSLFAGIVLVEVWDRIRSRRGPPAGDAQVS